MCVDFDKQPTLLGNLLPDLLLSGQSLLGQLLPSQLLPSLGRLLSAQLLVQLLLDMAIA
jgi:hypothetical protein